MFNKIADNVNRVDRIPTMVAFLFIISKWDEKSYLNILIRVIANLKKYDVRREMS